jgi:hypothetical protein
MLVAELAVPHYSLPCDRWFLNMIRMKFHMRRCLAALRASGLLWLGLTAFLAFAEAPPPIAGGFTLAVLPDTQNYAEKFPATYEAQTRWIADNVQRYGVAYVLHVGDVTQKNLDSEWQVAKRAHALLDGRVPYVLLPGNHDLGGEGAPKSRQTLLSDSFPVSAFRKWPTFGGVYDKEPGRLENSFHRFTAGGRQWLVLALEFGPRNDVVRWANDVVKQHPDRSVILVTHAYLRPDNKRFDRNATVIVKKAAKSAGLDNFGQAKSPEGFNDGEDLWQKLVSQHANFALVISGHSCVTARLDSQGKAGNTVHQMMVDYQNQANGGDGFLRLLQFHPDGRKVSVRDYSPTLGKLSEIPGANYEFDVSPAPKGK